MGWLETGLDWFKIAKDFLDKDNKEEGNPQSGGFLSKQVQNRFGIPKSPGAAGFSLLQKGIGRSTQGMTDNEKILEPIHRLQSNGYDALSNALIQKAIKDGNMITSRDLMPETSAHSDSQNISLGKATL
tara:strand:+ start:1692 stop:2078 length:387 start_codon:yes stop_codon:yes gene_type:complete